MTPPRAATSVLAAGLFGVAAGAARADQVGPVEQRVFRVVNGGIGVGERPLWLVMQMGNGLTALAAPVALRAGGRSWPESLQVGIAAHGAWQIAKVVKAVVDRGRPAALLPDVVLRDGNPTGRGFVSGHATVATTVAIVAGPMVPRWLRRSLSAGAAAVAFARVHVGAHLPLDVVGGGALAVVWSHLIVEAAASVPPGWT